MFACLYEGPGLLILRLLNSDGSVLNPAEAGFNLRNITWDQSNEAGGAGNDFYFVVLKTEQYSLRLHSAEVWTFGEPRTFGPAPSTVSDFLSFSQSWFIKCCAHIIGGRGKIVVVTQELSAYYSCSIIPRQSVNVHLTKSLRL